MYIIGVNHHEHILGIVGRCVTKRPCHKGGNCVFTCHHHFCYSNIFTYFEQPKKRMKSNVLDSQSLFFLSEKGAHFWPLFEVKTRFFLVKGTALSTTLNFINTSYKWLCFYSYIFSLLQTDQKEAQLTTTKGRKEKALTGNECHEIVANHQLQHNLQ